MALVEWQFNYYIGAASPYCCLCLFLAHVYCVVSVHYVWFVCIWMASVLFCLLACIK